LLGRGLLHPYCQPREPRLLLLRLGGS
jgi:hypothetical protein